MKDSVQNLSKTKFWQDLINMALFKTNTKGLIVLLGFPFEYSQLYSWTAINLVTDPETQKTTAACRAAMLVGRYNSI